MNFPRILPVLCRGQFVLKNGITKRPCLNIYENKSLGNRIINAGVRLVSTCQVGEIQKDEGFLKRLLKKIPLLNTEGVKTKASGYLLYENIADKIDYADFFEKFHLPDTFYSWFVITELHIWMISARAMAEGDQGKLLRNSLVEALWADVARRVKKLGAANPSATRAQVQELSEQLQAALISYDEGLQSDDVVLASALWRRVYQMEFAYPQHLEELVSYIRKHIHIMDHLSMEQILRVKPVRWEPL